MVLVRATSCGCLDAAGPLARPLEHGRELPGLAAVARPGVPPAVPPGSLLVRRPHRNLPATDLTSIPRKYRYSRTRRRGRVAEGGGLLNRYTLQRRIEGSNPSVSASTSFSMTAAASPARAAADVSGHAATPEVSI